MPFEDPVQIDAAKCSFLIIPNRDFDSYAIQSNGIKLIEVTGGKLTYYKFEHGEWRQRINGG